MIKLVSLLQQYFGEERVSDYGKAAKQESKAAVKKEDFLQERCMCCGVVTNYFEMMYDNGYAVCRECHKTGAKANYYGRSIWL